MGENEDSLIYCSKYQACKESALDSCRFQKTFQLFKKTTWIHLYVCMLFFNIVAIHSDLDGEAEDKFLDTTSKKTPVSSLSHSHFHLPLHFFVRQKPFSTHVYQEVNRW